MKKKLESELISIAHRVLKLTSKEDLNKMQAEVALLYQKITILKFLDDHYNGEIPDDAAIGASFFSALDGAFNNKVSDAIEVEDKVFVNIDNAPEEPLMEPAIEKIKDIVAQMPEETAAVDELVDEINTPEKIEEDLSELSPNLGQLPIFDPVEPENKLEKEPSENSLTAVEKTSLNETFKSAAFHIGLNDRLAFVNHLFENNNEDYDRVISQLNTMDSFEEITDFLENIIKPDYNNWDGKEDYETRFLDIIEQKFH